MSKELEKIKTTLKAASNEELWAYFKVIHDFMSTTQENMEVLERHIMLLSEISEMKGLTYTSYFLEKAAESIFQIDRIDKKEA